MIALLFDCETTSLISNRMVRDEHLPEIIEFYGEQVDLSTGEVLISLEYLICPSRQLSDEIVKLTGITMDMLVDKPRFRTVADDIFALIENAPYVIAHNASFDKECIDIEAARLQRTVKWPRVCCSVEQTVHLTGKRLSLTKLHELLFEKKFVDAHRAKTDVEALTRCAIKLYERGEL